MLEGGAFWATVVRGWRLTRGGFWRLTGLYVLVTIASMIVAGIIATPVQLIAMLITQDQTLTGFTAVAITSVGDVIATTLTTVFAARLRPGLHRRADAHRGLDVELARAAAQG
ncbi:hypothetical protein [Cellulomonas denverensis]|uniref:hypothetical protein n=1 Tax=Cellulomonas denverensis TaxID=264297 RepID=UPI0035F0B46F